MVRFVLHSSLPASTSAVSALQLLQQCYKTRYKYCLGAVSAGGSQRQSEPTSPEEVTCCPKGLRCCQSQETKLSVRARRGAGAGSPTGLLEQLCLNSHWLQMSPLPHASHQGFQQKSMITQKLGKPKFLVVEAGMRPCIQGE